MTRLRAQANAFIRNSRSSASGSTAISMWAAASASYSAAQVQCPRLRIKNQVCSLPSNSSKNLRAHSDWINLSHLLEQGPLGTDWPGQKTTSFREAWIKIGEGKLSRRQTGQFQIIAKRTVKTAGLKQQMSPVISGIFTSICFLQGICLLPRASQLGPSMGVCEMSLSQMTTWHFMLLWAAALMKAPEGTYTLLTGFLAMPRTSWNPTTVTGCQGHLHK